MRRIMWCDRFRLSQVSFVVKWLFTRRLAGLRSHTYVVSSVNGGSCDRSTVAQAERNSTEMEVGRLRRIGGGGGEGGSGDGEAERTGASRASVVMEVRGSVGDSQKRNDGGATRCSTPATRSGSWQLGDFVVSQLPGPDKTAESDVIN